MLADEPEDRPGDEDLAAQRGRLPIRPLGGELVLVEAEQGEGEQHAEKGRPGAEKLAHTKARLIF